jgi:hypothetical protein
VNISNTDSIQKRLELRNNEPAVGLKCGGNKEKWACHIGLLFPHDGPIFRECPRVISKDLIAPRHQSGIFGNISEFIEKIGKREIPKRIFCPSGSEFKSPISRFFDRLTRTLIDLNSSMRALPWQPLTVRVAEDSAHWPTSQYLFCAGAAARHFPVKPINLSKTSSELAMIK